MALGSKAMSVSMKVARGVTKVTKIPLKKTSSVTLKTVWKIMVKKK